MSLEWRGDEVRDKVRQAQKRGVNIIIERCLREAKDLVHVRTGTLQRSLKTPGAKETRDGVEAQWGSFDVEYAFWQEVLPPEKGGKAYLRPSADRHYPELGDAIRKAM